MVVVAEVTGVVVTSGACALLRFEEIAASAVGITFHAINDECFKKIR